MNTTETVLIAGIDCRHRQLPRTLNEAIEMLCDAESAIPAEYRDSARVDFEPQCEYGEYYAQVRVTYSRPMTDAELEQHAADESKHWAEQLRCAEDRVAYCRSQMESVPC